MHSAVITCVSNSMCTAAGVMWTRTDHVVYFVPLETVLEWGLHKLMSREILPLLVHVRHVLGVAFSCCVIKAFSTSQITEKAIFCLGYA